MYYGIVQVENSRIRHFLPECIAKFRENYLVEFPVSHKSHLILLDKFFPYCLNLGNFPTKKLK